MKKIPKRCMVSCTNIQIFLYIRIKLLKTTSFFEKTQIILSNLYNFFHFPSHTILFYFQRSALPYTQRVGYGNCTRCISFSLTLLVPYTQIAEAEKSQTIVPIGVIQFSLPALPLPVLTLPVLRFLYYL
jgi:hypothetical protein